MPRTSPTRKWVRQYAESTLLDGTPPTVSMLRQYIINKHGVTPSTTTVTNELALFWVDISRRIKESPRTESLASGDERNDEPFELSTLTDTPVVPDRVAELTRLQYSNMELSAKTVRLSREIEQLHRIVEDKDSLLAQSIRSTSKAAREVDTLEEKLARLNEEAARSLASIEAVKDEQMAVLRKEFEFVASELEAERIAGAKAREQLDGARRHLMLETDRVRSQSEAESLALKRELETARIREAQYLQQRNRAMERVDELEQALETAQRSQPSIPDGEVPTALPSPLEPEIGRAQKIPWQPRAPATNDPDAPAE